MALTSTDREPELDSSLEFEEDDDDGVFSNLSCYDLISCIQDLMSNCLDMARHVKIKLNL